jgi:hypothetical protein
MKLADKLHKLQSKMQTTGDLEGVVKIGRDMIHVPQFARLNFSSPNLMLGTGADSRRRSSKWASVAVASNKCQSLSAWETKLGRQRARARGCAVHHLVHHMCVDHLGRAGHVMLS